MLFEKGELKLLLPFYVMDMLIALSNMIVPFMMIYFLGIGFSFFQISILFATTSLSMFLFEIITGGFADSFSRKYSVIVGLLIAGITTIPLFFTTSFWIILILLFIDGIGLTFFSGADEAWVIDNLEYHRRKDLQKEYFVKSNVSGSIGSIIAPLMGAFAVRFYSIKLLWIVMGVGYLMTACFLLFVKEEPFEKEDAKLSNVFSKIIKNAKKGINYSWSHKLIFSMIMAISLLGVMGLNYDYWQPFLTNIGMPVYSLGIMISIVSIFGIIMSLLSKYLVKYNPRKVFISVIVFRALFLFSVWLLKPGLFILGVGIFIISDGLGYLAPAVVGPYFHKHIPSKVRATVLSVESMIRELFVSVGTLLLGFFSDSLGPQNIIVITGFFGIMAVYFLLRIKD